MEKWIYSFGKNGSEGNSSMRNLLGGKGANLSEMSNLGLPVPPGFTITTDVCTYYYNHGKKFPSSLDAQIKEAVERIEEEYSPKSVKFKFGDEKAPLLVSVRSGARASMPGMMDTVLNLGLNDKTVKGLSEQSNDERFAYDSYRRFIQMYGNVVLDIDSFIFEELLEQYKEDKGYHQDTEISADEWKTIIQDYKKIVVREAGHEFPQDVHEQLHRAIQAVFDSWQNQRAITYRRLNSIPEEWGTAVNIQAMVFGNMGDSCATGVAFTRNPSIGDNDFYGEFLVNAQGEDVVAGIRTPQPLTEKNKQASKHPQPSLEKLYPETYQELCNVRDKLEKHFKDMQDIEFTVQKGTLWMLQTRSGKRTTKAALRIAIDMVNEGLIDKETAIQRIEPSSLDQLLHPTLDPEAKRVLLTKGLPASPGAASGAVVFTPDEAETLSNMGENVILVRIETSPDDIHGMHAAKGILTTRGGMTSHAAVVARGMGRPCVSGAGSIKVNYEEKQFFIGDQVVKAGDKITVDGSTGEVFAGEVSTIPPELSGDFATIISWADTIRTMKVRANAETLLDAQTALDFGAQGIGLCRTEHMFFEPERILAVREMIMAEDAQSRKKSLERIVPMQRKDFIDLFTVMKGLPVTVRLLDPPLHEFLPHTEKELKELADETGIAYEKIHTRVQSLKEANPMLGHRGCRLGITAPEIYEIQAQAIIEAAIEVQKNQNTTVIPEIMIPLIATKAEFDRVKGTIENTIQKICKKQNTQIDYLIGSMIELPRAALISHEVAPQADFFSFGTNDLTQSTFGLSRDDSAHFLDYYIRHNILEHDPFMSLDQTGVGALVKLAAQKSRNEKPSIKLGICGEHGGDPQSIDFFQKVGLDYVSCSPYRVPIARLAAAQAALREKANVISVQKNRDVA